MLSACVCAGCQELKGLKCNPFYRKPVACHRFICAGVYARLSRERKDVTTQVAACGLSNTCAWDPPALHFQAVVVMTGADLGDAVWSVCAPRKSSILCPEARLYFLLCALGDKFALHPRRKCSIFSRLFAL